MKFKLLILSLLFCLNSFGQKLPITPLCWADVATYFSASCLSDAFTAANPAYFDADYIKAGGDWLSEFRNYGPPDATSPTVTTTAITSITGSGATSGGNVTSDGGATVTARGIAWGLSTNPTTAGNTVSGGSGIGSYSATITTADYYTVIYVRAYAINSIGTAYGSNVSFTTNPDPNYVYTGEPPLSIGSITADVFGIATGGHGTVSVRGFCWNTGGAPTLSDTVVTSGSGVGAFYSTLTGLTASTHYHYRAYVTISGTTYYGADINFITTL